MTDHPPLRLTVLATSDLHAHLFDYDYFRDKLAPTGGLAALAPVIAQMRAQHPDAILVDNGDTFQGTPLGDLAALWMREDAPARHPMVAAMGALGYDAMTLGNHDFNFGLPVLDRILGQIPFGVVQSNLRRLDGGPFPPASLMLTRDLVDRDGQSHPLRIGLVGVMPPQVMIWDKDHLQGRISAQDIVPAAVAAGDDLRRAGADVVIALCHSGLADLTQSDGENMALALAQLPQIDALVIGHTHRRFPAGDGAGVMDHPLIDPARGLIAGKPAVQPGFHGRDLGVLQLDLEPRPSGGWQMLRGFGALLPAQRDGPSISVDLTESPRRAHEATLAVMRRAIGESLCPLETYFAQIAPARALGLLAAAQIDAARAALTGDARALPILAAVAPFRAGGRAGPQAYTDIPAGPLARKHAADLYVYPNRLAIVEVTGAILKAWLERAASHFDDLPDDPDAGPHLLIDPQSTGYNFDIITGIAYEIDLAGARCHDGLGHPRAGAGGRIRNLTYQGRPIAPSDRFVIATNSYRAGGGGHYPMVAEGRALAQNLPDLANILAAFITRESPILPQAGGEWSFAPLGGRDVIFETGFGARNHEERIAQLGLRDLGDGETGFARFMLTL